MAIHNQPVELEVRVPANDLLGREIAVVKDLRRLLEGTLRPSASPRPMPRNCRRRHMARGSARPP
eukprot:11155956-Lingulodinium_polyedra.AAC.1